MRERQMEQPKLNDPFNDTGDELARKHGNTCLSTLRRIYGEQFALDLGDTMKLADALVQIDGNSLNQLLEHHRDGSLPRLIAVASVYIQ